MVQLSLANLGAWSVQAAALVAAGAWLPTRMRLGVPRARLLVFRVLLVACVALPIAQPWKAVPAPAKTIALLEAPAVTLDAPPAIDAQAVSSSPATLPDDPAPLFTRVGNQFRALPWPALLLAVLAAGTFGRLAWLSLGLVSLARLRRSSRPVELRSEVIDEAVRAVGTTAAFRESSRVARPVTFGLRAPVVIVPPGFTSLEAAQQRAVACHELLHVKRQDWLRTFADEIVRSVLWFHPAIWWLVEQIHLSGEQTIDREVVALVGDRRSYLRALLALAESGGGPRLQPAAAFLDHGHLRQRVAMLMEEGSMSRARLVASLAFVLAVVATGGWWSVSAFPLRGAPGPVVASSPMTVPALAAVPLAGAPTTFAPVVTGKAPSAPSVAPPAPPAPQQATQPGVPTPPMNAMPDEASLKRNIQLNPKDLTNYFVLGVLYEKAGEQAKAAAAYEAAIKAVPTDSEVYLQAAAYYNRQGSFEKCMDALSRWATTQPNNKQAHHSMAAYYWEKAYRDQSLSDGQKRAYIEQGLASVDRALVLNPEYPEALTYKNLLFRSLALLETDENAKQQLIAEADKLRDQVIALRRARAGAAGPPPQAGAAGPPPQAGAAGPPPQADAAALAEQIRAFLERELAAARASLAVMEQRYRPEHPDVVRMKKTVQELELRAQQAAVAAQLAGPPPPPPPPPTYLGGVAGGTGGGAYRPGTATVEQPKVAGTPVRVGGNILPPTKIVDVKPEYPPVAASARVAGVVIIEARIGTDGKIEEAKVLRSIPLLDQAALDAVKQWEFTVTRLNGVPVPVILTVTVPFGPDK